MNNFLNTIRTTSRVIASPKNWIDSLAIDQLNSVMNLEGMRHVVGLPDLHPGKGTPVGAAFLTDYHIYPHLVGNDIGCGMSFWQTELKTGKIKLDKWTKNINDLEGPWDGNVDEWLSQYGVKQSDFNYCLGTIGGGNHFAELQKVEEIIDSELFESLQLSKKALYLLVHSGSRGLGEKILQTHINKFKFGGIPSGSSDAADYLINHDLAVLWAKANRDLIAERFSNCLKTDGRKILDITHNYMDKIICENKEYWIHRKGATPADVGPVIIPGSRGDFSYLVIPKNANFSSGFSLKENLKITE
jgi:release factor H-coupled RctB family protein